MDNWYLSWTINRQPQFKAQDKNTVLIWVYALTTNKEGNYVKKAMRDCTGEEVCREWLYHIGVPTDQIPGTVCGDTERHYFYDRILHPYRYGSSLHTYERRSWCSGGVGLEVRCT